MHACLSHTEYIIQRALAAKPDGYIDAVYSKFDCESLYQENTPKLPFFIIKL